jgi:pyrroloquinoline quinone biosynthesis protein E
MIEHAVEAGAGRIEVAHAIPCLGPEEPRRAHSDPRAVHKSVEITNAAKERLKGILVFDVVAHDHYAVRPKPCMGGWGRNFIDVTPAGNVLPCHACESIPGLEIDNVRTKPLADIWSTGQAFQKFRGTEWMREPCRSCERREIDWGGCRCQALTMTGDAANADPACALSPWHKDFVALAELESRAPPPPYAHAAYPGVSPTFGTPIEQGQSLTCSQAIDLT